MNNKFARLLAVILSVFMCMAAFAACDVSDLEAETEPATTGVIEKNDDTTEAPTTADGEEDATTEAPTTEQGGEEATTEAPVQLTKPECDAKFSEQIFQNYTVNLSGIMTVTENGVYNSTADMSQTVKVTSDKISLTLMPGTEEEFSMEFEGETAIAEKEQNAHIFMLILKDYDSFVYDAENNVYLIGKSIVIEETGYGVDGNGELIDMPIIIEFKEAVVTFADNGMIATLVCDYSQTIVMQGTTIVTAGETTWTFTDFGTTIIE